jgi:hypothetical protein
MGEMIGRVEARYVCECEAICVCGATRKVFDRRDAEEVSRALCLIYSQAAKKVEKSEAS